MGKTNEPSTGQQLGAALALLVIDLMVIAWLTYGYGMAGWADAYESDTTGPSDASRTASQAAWLLAGAAALSGGTLLALRWRIPGTVQLIVLGGTAALFASGA
ncbi:hypothetical protein [Streptomyces parvulus]|uniref:hypothetical protein n=1 Tax=Streptomyces parvulus TaxID=146923 RepID=UPI0037B1B8DB